MSDSLTQLLHALLGKEPADGSPAQTLKEWKTELQALANRWPDPGLRAIAAGFATPHLGLAFAAGYQAALERLTGHVDHHHFYALCVTEQQGNRPRDIQTRLTANANGWVLDGVKTYVTGADEADHLLVAATRGEDDAGRPRICMARIALPRQGVTLTKLPPLAFLPHIPHASIQFNNVGLSSTDILSGDGYLNYVKPFRTLEDIHVELAISGHLLRYIPRDIGYQPQLTRLLVSLAALLQLAQMEPLDPATHLLLAGQREQLESWITDMEPVWAQHYPEFYQAWLRDKALLKVAAAARQQRMQTAWQQLLGDSKQ